MSEKTVLDLRKAGFFLLRAIAVLIFAPGLVQAQVGFERCGGLAVNFHEPFDYTSPADQERLQSLEWHHFTRDVEQLSGHEKCGGNRCGLAEDIDFTLRHYPNHYRALLSMVNYHVLGYDKSERPMRYTPECYFNRAFRFRPKDPILHMINGHYLAKTNEPEHALQKYKDALALAPNSAEAHYNIALLYVDRREYPLAREHAHTAYSLGFPLPGLRAKLERAGQWEEPEPGAPGNPE